MFAQAYPPEPGKRHAQDEGNPLTETVRDFLDPADFYNTLKKRGMEFYTGVPDSLLKVRG